MKICGLCTIKDGKQYNQWVQAIQKFQQAMTEGIELTERITASNVYDIKLYHYGHAF